MSAISLMRLLPKPIGQSDGQVLLDNTDILSLKPEEMLKIRGKKISMIFQEPMTALNPVHSIGKQLIETYLCTFRK